MANRKPKFDQVLNGIRVRVYATRTEYEVIYNDDDINDLSANVRVYPKVGSPGDWAAQGRLQYEEG